MKNGKRKETGYLCLWVAILSLFFLGCGKGTAGKEEETSIESVQETESTEDATSTLLRIAVVDSGISTRAIELGYLAEGKNYVDETQGTEDTYGHGTAVASIIMNQAENGNFVLVPLVNTMYEKGHLKSIDADTLATVIREAIDLFHCDIIHISGGVQTPKDSLEQAVAYAKEKGVTIVAAVGNDYEENPGALLYPAAYPGVISVGALDQEGNRAAFSQDWAKEYAIGVDVTYLLISGNEDTGSATSYAAAAYTATLIR